jgi:glycosyltransferase involved in cell wall biosynthesis
MLIGRFYPVEGGAEIQCRRLSNELRRRGHVVSVLTQALPARLSRDTIDGFPVYRIGLPLNGKIGSLSYVLHGFLWLLRHGKEFELLHVHMASAPALLAVAYRGLRRIRVIVKFAGSRNTGDIRTSAATWYGRLKLALLRDHADGFVCPSREIRDELLAYGFPAEKISVIPNGVDTGVFTPAGERKAELRRELDLPLDMPVVLYCGRLQAGKGLDVLLGAWPGVAEASRSIKPRLIIAGDGPMAERLMNDYGRMETVRFVGWKRNTLEYLQAADIFVLPSFGEGMPNALLEAMSCGLPCVTTAIGGIRDIVTDGVNGVLVAPGNGPLLAQRIRELMDDRERAAGIGLRGRASIEANLSLGLVTARYEELYHSLAA